MGSSTSTSASSGVAHTPKRCANSLRKGTSQTRPAWLSFVPSRQPGPSEPGTPPAVPARQRGRFHAHQRRPAVGRVHHHGTSRLRRCTAHSHEAANRAGVLRHLALKALGEKRDRTRDGKLAIDACLVAIAEELSRTCAVTILTGDLEDIQSLVDLTGRPNIAVVKI